MIYFELNDKNDWATLSPTHNTLFVNTGLNDNKVADFFKVSCFLTFSSS